MIFYVSKCLCPQSPRPAPTEVDDVEDFGAAVGGDGGQEGAAAVAGDVADGAQVRAEVLDELEAQLLLAPELDVAVAAGRDDEVCPDRPDAIKAVTVSGSCAA